MALCLWVVGMAQAEVPNPPLQHPIVFVAQIPPMRGYPSLNDVFTNHIASPEPAPRGSDLYILYPDGSLKNLTAAAGWGYLGVDHPIDTWGADWIVDSPEALLHIRP